MGDVEDSYIAPMDDYSGMANTGGYEPPIPTGPRRMQTQPTPQYNAAEGSYPDGWMKHPPYNPLYKTVLCRRFEERNGLSKR